MTNDPRTDLIYAILAMDSYNRGYGASVNGLSDAEDIAIGNFRIYDRKSDAEALNAGFYALAYQKGSEIVISYRGTDRNGLGVDPKLGGSDAVNGYGIALGSTTSPQGKLAAAFYQTVANVTGDGVPAGHVTLTGQLGAWTRH